MTYNEKIVDITTGDEIIRPFTKEEIAKVEAAQAQAEADQLAAEAEVNAKAEAKSELLAKLGITEAEAKLLLL